MEAAIARVDESRYVGFDESETGWNKASSDEHCDPNVCKD
jgi:hypothetical protein